MRFSFKKLLIFLIVTRILLLVLPWLTTVLLFPESKALNFWQFTQTSWNRWDAPHYLYLAQHWYTSLGDPANFIVFFPLYPLILMPLVLFFNPVVTGVVVSNVLFLFGAYFLYKLVEKDHSKKIAAGAVIAVAIFPTSYFFNAPYTESLFLLISAATFYFAREKRWILAGTISGLGTLTRPFGILLLSVVLTEWYLSKEKSWKKLPIIILPSIIALLSYLYINKIVFGNPFEFQTILLLNWQKHLMSPVASILDSWRVAFSGGLNSFVIMVGWAEALTITGLWIITPFVFKYLRKSWAVYYLLSIIVISSTNFILSTPRYILSILPIFVLISLAEKNYLFKTIWRFIAVALLFCLSILFTRGQWAF